MANQKTPEALMQAISYEFRSREWLTLAMRHSSYTNEHKLDRTECNERLEFLGDAVLELITSEYLYSQYPKMSEGELTKLRASLVCEPTLAYDARVIDLGSYLLLGKGEDAGGGRNRDSVVSDAFEALIGAIFMDGGYDAARAFIMRFVLDDIPHKKLFHDSKTILQEIIQQRSKVPITYILTDERGPDHNKEFFSAVQVGEEILGEGSGSSKKDAEQQAAYDAICKLKEKDRTCI